VGGRTEQDEGRRERRDDGRVSTLLHDGVDDRDSETSKDSRERTHPNVGDVGRSVAVADVLKVELAIKADEPASESEEKFRQRGVHVEVVLASNVVGREFPEVNFVEAERLNIG